MTTALTLVLVCAAPAAALWLVFALPGAAGRIAEWHHRRRRALAGPAPASPPIERLAADLRRLRHQSGDVRRSRTQRHAARLAYEDVLRASAAALALPHRLTSACAGLERELELLRLEQALTDAGMVLSVPS